MIGLILWLMKVTIGRKQFQSILDEGFKANGPTMPATVPAADAQEDAAAVATLKSTVERFQQHDGELHPSMLFGTMTKEQGTQLQLRHIEHHLGFLVPESNHHTSS